MQVCNDIRSILRIEGCDLFKRSINRPNLMYEASDVLHPASCKTSVVQLLVMLRIFSTILLCHVEGASCLKLQVYDKPASAAEVTAEIVSYILETQEAGASGIVYCLSCKVGYVESTVDHTTSCGLSAVMHGALDQH